MNAPGSSPPEEMPEVTMGEPCPVIVLQDTDLPTLSESPEDSAVDKVNKVYVKLIVHKLACRAFKKAKMNWGHPENFIDWLLDKVWAEIQGADNVLTLDAVQHIDKDIFKELCRKWDCAEFVLVAMAGQDVEIADYISLCLKYHLLTPRKKSRMSRAFSSLGRALSKPFRRQ